jgi:hypothetical protein
VSPAGRSRAVPPWRPRHAILLTLGLGSTLGLAQTSTAYFDRAREKQNRGEWDGAIVDCTRYLEMAPNL